MVDRPYVADARLCGSRALRDRLDSRAGSRSALGRAELSLLSGIQRRCGSVLAGLLRRGAAVLSEPVCVRSAVLGEQRRLVRPGNRDRVRRCAGDGALVRLRNRAARCARSATVRLERICDPCDGAGRCQSDLPPVARDDVHRSADRDVGRRRLGGVGNGAEKGRTCAGPDRGGPVRHRFGAEALQRDLRARGRRGACMVSRTGDDSGEGRDSVRIGLRCGRGDRCPALGPQVVAGVRQSVLSLPESLVQVGGFHCRAASPRTLHALVVDRCPASADCDAGGQRPRPHRTPRP